MIYWPTNYRTIFVSRFRVAFCVSDKEGTSKKSRMDLALTIIKMKTDL